MMIIMTSKIGRLVGKVLYKYTIAMYKAYEMSRY